MSRFSHFFGNGGVDRRDWMRLSAAGVLGCSLSGWIESLAAGKSVIEAFGVKPAKRG